MPLGRPAADDAARRAVPPRRRRDVRRRAAAALGEAGAARRSQSHSAGDAAAARRGRRGAGCSWTAASGDKMPDEGARHLRARSHACTSITRWPSAASTRASIDFVLATHLHFDHFGGATARDAHGAGAALSERALPDPRRRVGGRDASARAQPRQLPAGRLRAAEARPASWTSIRRRRDDEARRARGAHRRPHRPASDRLPRVRRQDGGVRGRPDSDHRPPAGSRG